MSDLIGQRKKEAAAYFHRLADKIEGVRSTICPYGAGEFESCDCKYGLKPGIDLSRSEQTGCPELRDIVKSYRDFAGERE